jgi:hypothetical protein
MNETEQSWLDQRYNAPVQRGIERKKEVAQSQRTVGVLDFYLK